MTSWYNSTDKSEPCKNFYNDEMITITSSWLTVSNQIVKSLSLSYKKFYFFNLVQPMDLIFCKMVEIITHLAGQTYVWDGCKWNVAGPQIYLQPAKINSHHFVVSLNFLVCNWKYCI